MAMQSREIKARIKSITNTEKITGTMELVAAAKMRRAISSAVNSRTYAVLAWDIMKRLSESMEPTDTEDAMRFFAKNENPEHTTIIMLTSNRGLCGAFNSNVLKQVFAYMKQHGKENVDVVGIGKRGISVLNAYGVKAELAYEKDDSASSDESISDVAAHVYKKFKEGTTQKVLIAYTHFQSPVIQTAQLKQLFPLPSVNEFELEVEDKTEEAMEPVTAPMVNLLYTYEPSGSAVLDYLIPRIAESEIYQALLESNASEHSSRMVAMKNATDAAGEMGDELKLAFNRARQAGITQEIAEISAGTEALS